MTKKDMNALTKESTSKTVTFSISEDTKKQVEAIIRYLDRQNKIRPQIKQSFEDIFGSFDQNILGDWPDNANVNFLDFIANSKEKFEFEKDRTRLIESYKPYGEKRQIGLILEILGEAFGDTKNFEKKYHKIINRDFKKVRKSYLLSEKTIYYIESIKNKIVYDKSTVFQIIISIYYHWKMSNNMEKMMRYYPIYMSAMQEFEEMYEMVIKKRNKIMQIMSFGDSEKKFEEFEHDKDLYGNVLEPNYIEIPIEDCMRILKEKTEFYRLCMESAGFDPSSLLGKEKEDENN